MIEPTTRFSLKSASKHFHHIVLMKNIGASHQLKERLDMPDGRITIISMEDWKPFIYIPHTMAKVWKTWDVREVNGGVRLINAHGGERLAHRAKLCMF